MITTYTLNGVDLDSNTLGTNLQASSKPRPGIERRTVTVSGGARDGNTPVAQSSESPVVTLVVRVPEASEEAFLALLSSPVLTLSHDGREAVVELLAAGAELGFLFTDYSCVFRFPAMFWRDPAVTTTTALAISSASVTADIMSGLSAPVRDSVVRIKGGVTNPKVTDSQGSSFQYIGTLPTTSWLRFHSDTGRAYTTTTDVWTGGTEVTGSILTGPTTYPFELTPKFTDPSVRVARYTVTTTARTGSPTIEIRGKRAYRI